MPVHPGAMPSPSPLMAPTAASTTIDLNADCGEGFGRWSLTDDDALLNVVSSANVACGFHAGDPPTLRRVCELAAQRRVAVGAQISYPDRVGFGRRRIECTPAELSADALYQAGAVHAFCVAAGIRLTHVKPHGALYHELATDADRAAAVVAALAAFDPSLRVLGPPGSALLWAAAAAGLRAVREGFPDRAYDRHAQLLPRTAPGAILSDPADVAERAVAMAVHRRVVADDGTVVPLEVDSLCIHGDSPRAVPTAQAVRRALETAGCSIRGLG